MLCLLNTGHYQLTEFLEMFYFNWLIITIYKPRVVLDLFEEEVFTSTPEGRSSLKKGDALCLKNTFSWSWFPASYYDNVIFLMNLMLLAFQRTNDAFVVFIKCSAVCFKYLNKTVRLIPNKQLNILRFSLWSVKYNVYLKEWSTFIQNLITNTFS